MTVDDYPIDPTLWKERTGRVHASSPGEYGKERFIVVMRNGWVADSFEEAARVFGTHAAAELRFYFRQGIFNNPDFPTEESITPESVAPHQVIGTPQQCIEALERYHEEFGIDYFTIRFRMPTGPPMDAALEQIQRFGEEVVAPIHKKYPAPDHPAIPAACRW